MTYIQHFEVHGRGPFPVDMLRYDYCFPRDSEDALNIADAGESCTVKLTRYVHQKDAKPTQARWESFGWRVVEKQTTTRKV